MRYWAVSLLLILWNGVSLAVPLGDGGNVRPAPQYTVKVTPTILHVGEPFAVDIEISHDLQSRFEMKTPTETASFDVLGIQRNRSDGDHVSKTKFTLQLSAFALGKLTTPDLDFDFTEGGQTEQLHVPGTSIDVIPSDAAAGSKKGELFDIRPPEAVPVRSWTVAWCLSALLAVALGMWLWKKRRRGRTHTIPAISIPVIPLYDRTMSALATLEKDDLPGQGLIREFYFRLSDITRGYLGERFNFEALECTSFELMRMLRKTSTTGFLLEDMQKFVDMSDMAKFAKANPSIDDCKSSLNFARTMVQNSKPIPVARSSPHAPTQRLS